MPELPEVETTRRGIKPHLVGKTIQQVTVHNPNLRWPVPTTIKALQGAIVASVTRRGKYLLVDVPAGTAIVHLGMSGSLRISPADEPRRKHDHIELLLESGDILRFHDPRRFGCFLWAAAGEPPHKLLASLGPEPLANEFNAEYLFQASRKRQVPIKNFIMNSQIVVGVGNIYASESLFMAGIRPARAAKTLTRKQAEALVEAIKLVLQRSITQGGTTLRDFTNSDGNPGYFAQSLQVYGRTDEPCRKCRKPIKQSVIGQRSTFYCSHCQK
ncbi:bifunctional DNA-formamidopyrimidine glycosylase/DNA-(apurinic or apyrimidinic site) lyase [Granulosicoccus antarcticus]|uniref:Formamidopyrimidine-DNA glycosylase n=1 Tax=Granulosicoccus antarcticus IMCC3135 TaxID=1192854 RepID=A0A2Z2NJ26_9GAMM|nr:bifunctional DNA-formamidopyrimidine glycosylase/DNA-(apurinic or apyrimidinic site) lyase [Granulosicoccus antarcticus]ASJ71169.1 Formamidopyrimidine-DNA glycosylase [Granulosicoccus antarcticus IMCC3135]